MLQFFSGSARIINTRRAVTECMEIALGEHFADTSLVILHASMGHNFQEMVDQVHELAPKARIVAASCCGVVGREGVSESMKDMALMAVKGKEFALAFHQGHPFAHPECTGTQHRTDQAHQHVPVFRLPARHHHPGDSRIFPKFQDGCKP
jgi:hypothetical protein